MKLSNHHEKVLDHVFAHPLPHNLEWHDVLSLLEALGEVEDRGEGRLHVTVNGVSGSLHRKRHKDLSTDDVVDVRHLLERAGVALH